ncbi:DUF222 domain-containing protein [Streptomyces hygroscopicus]|uniref:DUF222 domain-containing protein n=1 Tax=Streptomyces hygroscopicus TaxID=1912 RepID=UPI00368E5DD0
MQTPALLHRRSIEIVSSVPSALFGVAVAVPARTARAGFSASMGPDLPRWRRPAVGPVDLDDLAAVSAQPGGGSSSVGAGTFGTEAEDLSELCGPHIELPVSAQVSGHGDGALGATDNIDDDRLPGAPRLLLVGPELADVLSATISRLRGPTGAMSLMAAYDVREKVWNPPMPLLFHRGIDSEHRAFTPTAIRKLLISALAATGLSNADGEALTVSPHGFRRILVTDAIMNGLPPAHGPGDPRAQEHRHHDRIQSGLSRRGRCPSAPAHAFSGPRAFMSTLASDARSCDLTRPNGRDLPRSATT